MWSWADRPVQRSAVLGVVGTPARSEQILFRLEGAPGLHDGLYLFPVPTGWASRPTRPSVWGSDIQELDPPQGELFRASPAILDAPRRPLWTLDFTAVMAPPPGPRAPPGGDDAPGWTTAGGPQYGVIFTPVEDAYFAEVFGYDPGRRRWIRIGEVPVDAPGPSGKRQTVAILLTPLTLCVDAALIAAVVLACAKGGGGSLSVPSASAGSSRHSSCRIQLAVHGLHVALSARRARRLRAVRDIRAYGMEAKSAVPTLRRLLHDVDPEVRLEAAVRLRVLCPYDPAFYMPTVLALLTGADVILRRKTAEALGRGKVHAAVPALARALRDPDEEVRFNAAAALGLMGAEAGPAVPALQMALNDPSPDVRAAAHKALWEIPRQR
jgi:hypothetical protein